MLLDRSPIRSILGIALALMLSLTACTPPENEGGTPLPSALSEPPLQDEAVGPSDAQEEIDEEGGSAP
ncbi:MAG TPA: hypothetical protein VF364_13270 [Candidatus Limnocylindria bacterium]